MIYINLSSTSKSQEANSIAKIIPVTRSGVVAHSARYFESLGASMERLNHTYKPVIEIAQDLGYTDASNFSRAFRRRTGMSPSDFCDGVK